MNKILCLVILLCNSFYSSYSQVGIGTTNPDNSSILDIQSTDKGILVPRLTSNQITAIVNPANGLLVYNTDLNEYQFNYGTSAIPDWTKVSHNMSVKYSNTDIGSNINTNTAINLPVYGITEWNDDTALYTIDNINNTITVNASGRYKINVNASISTTVNNARKSPEMGINISGNPIDSYASTGYIRYNGGHEESSLHLDEVLNLSATDVIYISIERAGAAGIVALRFVGSCNIYIEKIK